MSSDPVPLGVLDLVPISSGSSAAEAVRNTLDLARRAEEFGYGRYWFAEHHLNPGVAGTSPPVLMALIAGVTTRIRLGAGGLQSGHRTPLSVVEEFGLIDALEPGRVDLGLGRSGGRTMRRDRPAPRSPRQGLAAELLVPAGAETPDYGELVRDILGLLRGTYRSSEGLDPRPVPGQGASLQLWLLGSSAGPSANVAGELGLPFAANYHVSPATTLEAIDAYRAAFVPSPELGRPRVMVSADVVVGPDDVSARELAAGYGLWVRSIRSGDGAIEFPSPAEAARHHWTDEERALVADRVETQFVGSPQTVADGLRRLQQRTGADELLVTTITHQHLDRVRSYELLAKAWF